MTRRGLIFPLRIDPCSNLPSHVFSGGYGVIDMALLSVIRRWHFREHLSIREICRRTGLSRNTIRKYLRLDVSGQPMASGLKFHGIRASMSAAGQP